MPTLFFCSDLIFTYGNQADGHPGHPPHGCIALNLRKSERFYVSGSTFFGGYLWIPKKEGFWGDVSIVFFLRFFLKKSGTSPEELKLMVSEIDE